MATTEQLRVRLHTGWVRAVRDALGMSTRPLATRMGVAQATVVQMERSEAYETIQLATLRRSVELTAPSALSIDRWSSRIRPYAIRRRYEHPWNERRCNSRHRDGSGTRECDATYVAR